MISNVKFTMTVDSGDAAMVDDPAYELTRMLRDVANRVESHPVSHHHTGVWALFDSNGRQSGSAELTCEESDDE